MNKQATRSRSSALPRLFRATLIAGILPAIFLLSTRTSQAGSATWKTSPATGDWNHAANWTPKTIPNGSADTATFQSSNITALFLSLNTEVNGIVFNAGASAFTITAGPTLTLTVSGAGITNNSGITQEFVAATDINGTQHGTIQFTNGATAGNGTRITDSGPEASDAPGGVTQFFGSSSAGNAEIVNTIGSGGGFGGGGTEFYDNSTAGNAGFFNQPGFTFIRFFGSSTAGSGTFGNGGTVSFSDASNAGNGTFFTEGGDVERQPPAGSVDFFDTSTAGSGTFTNAGADTGDGTPGFTSFSGSSSAGNGTFTCLPGQEGGEGSRVGFSDASTADNATFTLEGATDISSGGGVGLFGGASTAGNATLIANGGSGGGGGGSIQFFSDSSGGQARVKVFGNGFLDIGGHNAPGVATGSIQGSGLVFLGALNLTVGRNNLDTIFSGSIQDGGTAGGTGGSLTKVGTSTLNLTKASTYTGGTTINHGKLLVTNKSGSATGSGAVQVHAGTLGGTGIISGAVTVGTGSSSGAILLPGNSATSPGTLTVNNTLTFQSLSTYKCVLNRTKAKASKVSALGVTINSNVPFTFVDTGTGTLTTGTVFTVINNTSANPIFGRFSNLAGGSVFTSNGNSFKVSYTGGTGNDLTLTVQ